MFSPPMRDTVKIYNQSLNNPERSKTETRELDISGRIETTAMLRSARIFKRTLNTSEILTENPPVKICVKNSREIRIIIN